MRNIVIVPGIVEIVKLCISVLLECEGEELRGRDCGGQTVYRVRGDVEVIKYE